MNPLAMEISRFAPATVRGDTEDLSTSSQEQVGKKMLNRGVKVSAFELPAGAESFPLLICECSDDRRRPDFLRGHGHARFLLIRSFLDADEIEMPRQDFEGASLEVNSNDSVRRLSAAAMDRLEKKFQEVNGRVAMESSVHVDCMNDGVYFRNVL